MTRDVPRRYALEISTTTRGVELTRQLQRTVRGCVSAAVARYSERVRRVAVWIEDTNGPRGGRAIVCRLVVRLNRGGHLTVSAEAVNEYAAVGRAAKRARAALVRRVKKMRRGRRRLQPQPAIL
jgi:hypothetical protein